MKILIADDHAIVREGLKQIVKSLPEITTIEEAENGIEALSKIKKGNYDIVILDNTMPGMTGLDILQNLKISDFKANVLMLSVHPQEQYAIRAFKLGACGYITKDCAYDELAIAIKKIVSGGKYIAKSFAEKFVFDQNNSTEKNPHEKLSEREFQVMIMLASGKSVTEIAKIIILSDKTISTYRSRILEKMGLTKNAELTLYAIKNSLIE